MTPVDLTKIDYRRLLRHNVPGSGPFLGTKYQRGGNMRGAGLGGVLTAALALIPRFLSSSAGKQLVSVGKSLASEIASGNDLKSSIKTVARQKLKEFGGSGRKRLRKSIKGPSVAVLKPHLVAKTSRNNFL